MTIPERVRFLQETVNNIETLVEVMRRHLDYLGGDIHRAEENGPSVFDPDAPRDIRVPDDVPTVQEALDLVDPTSKSDGGGGE